jgi:hypothetical protein
MHEDLSLELTESVTTVAEPYFTGAVEPFFSSIFNKFEEENRPQQAIKLLYYVTNYTPEKFETFMQEKLDKPDKLNDLNYQEFLGNLRTISLLCNGKIQENDRFFGEHRELVTQKLLGNDDLKVAIGQYFRENCNQYLYNKSPHLYDQIKKDTDADRSKFPSR